MSRNPWPLVLVGLGSLGCLATSMAQQTEPLDFSSEVPPASIQFPDLEEPDFSEITSESRSRWSDGRQTNAGARLGGDIEASTNQIPATGGGPAGRGNGLRRYADQPQGRIRNTPLAAAQTSDIQTELSRQRVTPRFDPQTETNAARQRLAQRDKALLESTGEVPTRGPLFDTRETAILGPPRVISANRSEPPNASLPSRDVFLDADRSEARSGFTEERNHVSGVEGENTSSGDAESKTSGKLPLWPTMALLASMAANVIFCWFAWDAHSKYQDLVEDMSESDTRLERQRRRLRKEDAPSRRVRDADDSDFLRTGVEA